MEEKKVYLLKIIDYFAAAHNLINYKGKCEELHGHNWKVEVIVKGEKLDKAGMLIDFKILKKYLKEILDRLDHAYLNELEYFKEKSPSSENIAEFIYFEMDKMLKDSPAEIEEVRCWESINSCAIYKR